MKELTLYNITNKIVDLMNKEELTEEEQVDLSNELTLELQKKSSNIIGYTKNIELTINAMKEEEKRISDLRKQYENKLDRFKTYVKDNMNMLGIDKIETELGTLTVARNPISVEILNQEEIPEEYKKEKTTISVDKTAIKKHFKETGEIVDGTTIIVDKTTLRIK